MAAGRVYDRNTFVSQPVHDILCRFQAIFEIILVQHLAQTNGHRLKIATGQPSVGWKALCQYQNVALTMRQLRIIGAEKSADVGESVLFPRHRAAIGITEHLARNINCAFVRVACLAFFDEVRIFRETAGVQIERNTKAARNPADFLDVRHRHGLSTAGVIGHGQHDHRDFFRPGVADQFLQRFDVHVAFERIVRVHVQCLGAGQINGLTTEKLYIRASRIKMRIVRNHRIIFDHHAEQDTFGRSTLVRRDNLLKSEDILDRVTESIPASGAGIGLITTHNASPGFCRHRAGS